MSTPIQSPTPSRASDMPVITPGTPPQPGRHRENDMTPPEFRARYMIKSRQRVAR